MFLHANAIAMSELQWKSALYQLRSRILSGELAGGSKLRASHLSEEMGISRTPVSEALIKLEGEGLLIRDKSGFTIRSFGVDEVYDAIDLRGLLEAAAIQKVAEHGVSSRELEQLNAALESMEQVIAAEALSDYDQLNLDFHTCLIELSESSILIEEIKRSYRLPFAGPSAFPTRRDDLDRFRASLVIGQEHHRQIVSAIQGRESGRAFHLMREHARLAYQNVRAAISARGPSPQLALVTKAS